MRRILFTLLLATMFVVTAIAEDFEVDGIYYRVNGNEATVTYRGQYSWTYNNEYSGDVIVPETVTYNGKTYLVTAIGHSAFSNCDELTSIVIPNTVTIIDNYAFDGCRGLTSLEIPNSVTTINYRAIRLCSNLVSATIGNSVTTIDSEAFTDCWKLANICIPASVTTIGAGAFSGCRALTSLIIPQSVTSIGYRAFSACSGLTSITVESGNQIYDSRDDCNAIIESSSNELIAGCKRTIIPNSVTAIGNGAFSMSGLSQNINIPNSITQIGVQAFFNCTGLTSIDIPNSVSIIGYGAFDGCSGLTSIHIPASVTSIGQTAFNGCNKIRSITVDEANQYYDSRNNCNAIIETASNTLFLGCCNSFIPNTVTAIGDYGFYYCLNLTSIEIPSPVTSLGKHAFYNCINLRRISIPNSVTSIGPSAFYNCNKLDTAVCWAVSPPSVNSSFMTAAYNKVTVFVPECAIESYRTDSVWGSFANIKSIESLGLIEKTGTPLVGEETQYTLSLVNNESDPEATIYYAFNGGDIWQEYTEPLVFEEFGYCYFENIRFYAVTEGKQPSDTVDYDFYVHRYCYDFIVDGIYYLKRGANSVAVSTMYDWYYRMSHNTPQCYSGKVVIPETVTYEGRNYTVTQIIPYAFYSCPGLTSVIIPNTVTSIGNNAFEVWFTSDLSMVDIGNSVESIGSNAFYHCDKIKRLICRPVTPPAVTQEQYDYGETFSCYDSATLFVPNESLEAYRTHQEWGKFSLIVPFIGAGPGDINGDGDISVSDVTGLIDLLLSGGSLPSYADADGDGHVSIKDVTTLIDTLLSGN